MLCFDYQVIMSCVPRVDGVENEESMWKHSPKSKAACQERLLLLPNCVPSHNFFLAQLRYLFFYNLSMKFLTKVCAVSVKMIIFAMSTENTA